MKQVANMAQLATCFVLVSFLTYSSTLKMETAFYSETSDEFQRNTHHYIRQGKSKKKIKGIPVTGREGP
jgi:hypothetical protein